MTKSLLRRHFNHFNNGIRSSKNLTALDKKNTWPFYGSEYACIWRKILQDKVSELKAEYKACHGQKINFRKRRFKFPNIKLQKIFVHLFFIHRLKTFVYIYRKKIQSGWLKKRRGQNQISGCSKQESWERKGSALIIYTLIRRKMTKHLTRQSKVFFCLVLEGSYLSNLLLIISQSDIYA